MGFARLYYAIIVRSSEAESCVSSCPSSSQPIIRPDISRAADFNFVKIDLDQRAQLISAVLDKAARSPVRGN